MKMRHPINIMFLILAMFMGSNALSQCDSYPDTCRSKQSDIIVHNGTKTSVYLTPFQGAFTDNKLQIIFRASELNSLGMTEGFIRGVALDVTKKLSWVPYKDFTISLDCTSDSVLYGGSMIDTGFTPVYLNDLTTVNGWNKLIFDTAYYWDGISNLVIQFCFDNTVSTNFDLVRGGYTPFYSARSAYHASGSGCTFTSPLYVDSLRPNVRFITCQDSVVKNFFNYEVSGRVFIDDDTTCTRDIGDRPAKSIMVHLQNLVDSSVSYYTRTDSTGYFEFRLTDSAIFSLTVESWHTFNSIYNCPPLIIDSISSMDTISAGHELLLVQRKCPILASNVYVSPMVPGRTGDIDIFYKNTGSDSAFGVYIDCKIDSGFIITGSTKPYSVISSDRIRFSIGTLPGWSFDASPDWSIITINGKYDTSELIGRTGCFSTEIFPIPTCLDTSSVYDGSDIVLRAECIGDSINRFIIKNIGSDMTSTSKAAIYEDDIIYTHIPYSLKMGDSLVHDIPIPSYADTGVTFTMITEQFEGHPYSKRPIVYSELCGFDTAKSIWFRGVRPRFTDDDEALYRSEYCGTYVGSYDPNDKSVTPVGFSPSHFVGQGTRLNYLINFQNTGTAPARHVVVVDTLDVELDWSTILITGFSHSMWYELSDAGVLKFHFDDINLVDSGTDYLASQGFVTYEIEHLSTTPIGTMIYNEASIFFDYNPPIETNTVFVTLGEDWFDSLTTSIQQTHIISTGYEVSIGPNPFDDQLGIRINGIENNDVIETITYDIYGRIIQSESFIGTDRINLRSLSNQSSGLYVLEIKVNGKIISVHKLVRK